MSVLVSRIIFSITPRFLRAFSLVLPLLMIACGGGSSSNAAEVDDVGGSVPPAATTCVMDAGVLDSCDLG